MDKFTIEGGYQLKGTIPISGSKNAALPILFATMLPDSPSTITNVPYLRDIKTTLKLLQVLGCEANFENNQVNVVPKQLTYEAPYDLVSTMRASALCLGPLLAKLGKAKVALPGGCAIGARPVDQHLKGFEALGVKFELEDGYISGYCKKLIGNRVNFDMPTVGGTENLLMAAVLAEGTTILANAACEPEIINLANYLNACGAKITGQGTPTITISGVNSLHGTTFATMPDRIEAGTYLIAAGITKSNLSISNAPILELKSTIRSLEHMGFEFQINENTIKVLAVNKLHPTNIETEPFPGFPTDMQAQIMALMCLANGTSTIQEHIFENRFMHVPELCRMGASIKILDKTATIHGVSQMKGAPVMASDLRASASLVIAGLAAKGTTHVRRIYHLDRGYEAMEKKLETTGAKIKREKE